MKFLKLKWVLPAICVAVVLLAVLIGMWIWRGMSFHDAPFGYQYSVVAVFFSDRDVPSLAPEVPEYALTEDGILLDINGVDSGRLSGAFRKFTLDQASFDDIFDDEGTWRVTGIDTVTTRKNNVSAWRYQKLDGSFYYVLLQKNGDVFLCIGEDGTIGRFYWLQSLGAY